MHQVVLIAVALLVVGLPETAIAGDDCASSARTQLELNDCAAGRHAQADALLNDRYRQIMARLGQHSPQKPLLIAAQRRWIAFRDAECRLRAASVAGGSIEPMVHSLCLAQLTEQRNRQLLDYLDCEEGDLSCPRPANDP